MPIAATIGAVGSVAAAGIGAGGSYLASRQQSKAAGNALDFQKGVYQTSTGNLQPWINSGNKASASLADLYGIGPSGTGGIPDAFQKFVQSGPYQFISQQGNLGLNRTLNAQGRQLSGAQVRASQDYNTGLASTYLMSNYVNPLFQMSGQGLQAGAALGSIGTGQGANIANTTMAQGAANASGIVGATNAIGGGISGAAGNLALYSSLGRNPSNPSGYQGVGEANAVAGGAAGNLGATWQANPWGGYSPGYTGAA